MSGCKWVRVGASECEWLRVGASGCGWVRTILKDTLFSFLCVYILILLHTCHFFINRYIYFRFCGVHIDFVTYLPFFYKYVQSICFVSKAVHVKRVCSG